MKASAKDFHLFPKLPLELQFRIWNESVKQSPLLVYELFASEPLKKDGDSVYECDNNWMTQGEDVPNQVDICDVELYERSVVFQRPLLEVDRTSRKENLWHYRFVKFSNTHLYMNMDVDIVYCGHFATMADLPACFYIDNSNLPFKGGDPFWATVKHMAYGKQDFQESWSSKHP